MRIKIYDISLLISEGMAVYKDKPEKKPKIIAVRSGGINESRLDLDSHTATHADAPYHMIEEGKKINEIGLDRFIGNCIVIDFTNINDSIKAKDFKKYKKEIIKEDIVLLKTKNGVDNKFNPNFAYLDKSGASFLASKKIKAVGIDALGIERSQPKHDTHIILLGKNIPIIEGLDLSKIKEGRFFFIGFPLKIKDGDAAPMRAVLIDESNIG